MALTPGKPAGSYFEFDQLCNENAIVVFRVLEHEKPRHMEQSGNDVDPVLVDFVVLTGNQEKTVVRRESVIKSGIAPKLREYAVGSDVVCVMGWKPKKFNPKDFYVIATPQTADSDAYTLAANVFDKTNGDPYTAVERAANPTATLTPAQPAPAPAQPPAADAPAPWGQNGNGGNAPAPVGGPQGPGWGESPATTNAQPVASGSVW